MTCYVVVAPGYVRTFSTSQRAREYQDYLIYQRGAIPRTYVTTMDDGEPDDD